MDNITRLSPEERSQVFSETSARMGTTAAIIEKDFWVCWVLEKIFVAKNLRNKLLFKGGTSLSKVYKVIERFSEKSKRFDFSLNPNINKIQTSLNNC